MTKMTCRIDSMASRYACWCLGRQTVFALVVALVIISGGTNMASAADKQLLTVRDAIETTRFMVADADGEHSIAVSPDGRRYAAMLIRGDIRRDGVEVEIISGGLDSVESAKPYSVARLFTRGLGATMLGSGGEAPQLLLPRANFPLWIDNERVAFLWDDDNGIRQVVAANVEKKGWSFLTDSTTDVTSFGTGAHNAMVYEAKQEFSLDLSNQRWRDGFTVTNPEAWSLLKGVVDGASNRDIAWGIGEKYVRTGGSSPKRARKLNVTGGGANIYQLTWPAIRPSVSPDGRIAIVSGTPQTISASWNRYEGTYLRAFVKGWENRRSSTARQLQQMFVVSVDDASARPLWNAPMNPSRFVTLRWAPDNHTILVWPVHLPVDSQDQAGFAGQAVAEVDVLTGKYTTFPVIADDATGVEDARWLDSGTVEFQLKDERVLFRKHAGRWVEFERGGKRHQAANVRVEVRQDPNTPPALYAVDARTGREEMVFDPNPRLRTDFSLGEVKFIEWQDVDGHRREGRLFLPVGYRSGQRYPLVIQTRTWGSRQDFTLSGKGSPSPTLGPMFSVYLAQPLANEGIAVLQLGPRPAGDPLPEAKSWMRGIESAIDHLDSIGVIDRDRVGIMGHSRSGWHVEYALAFSDYPFAAAIVDDNIDSGYVEAAMAGWADVEHRNGAEPFGVGMKDWLENAPGFNVEHIRAPLLMMVTDSFAGKATPVADWEMFGRLRYLQKPVELWVAPNIERGSHNLHNPTQLLAQQERGMDWWLYWLKGGRDSSEAKREQYAGWDRLRVLRDKDAQRPKPPRLRWTAEAVDRCETEAC